MRQGFLRFGMMGAAALLLTAASPAADVKAGVDAWARQDYATAVRIWRPVAEKGDPDAQFNLGQAYRLGRGVPADPVAARGWFEKAAAQGYNKAQATLGLMLFQSGDQTGAMPWLAKAAAAGDARSQYVYATALFNGDNGPRDWPNAYALMKRAADQGLPQAATSLVEMDRMMPRADREKGLAIAQQAAPQPAPAPRSTPSPAPTPTAVVVAAGPATGSGWRVQLGAYDSPAAARSDWTAISRRIKALAGLEPSYEPAGKFTRLRLGPLASRAEADRLCAAAKAGGQACFTIAP